jgi:hypothetical protein
VGTFPHSYYRDIYQGQATVSAPYRQDRDVELINRCDGLNLEPRVPQRIYAGKLSPVNEAALLLKHSAFRDRIQGRDRTADIHRRLAEQIYAGDMRPASLRESPLAPTIREILDRQLGRVATRPYDTIYNLTKGRAGTPPPAGARRR